VNASEPRKVAPAHSPTDTAPDAVGPSVARVEASDGQLWRDCHGDIWALGDDGLMHTKETAPFPREHVEKKWGPLLPAADSSAPAPDGHAALVARIEALIERPYVVPFSDRDDEGVLVSELRAAITATDRAASDESRVAECGETHPEDDDACRCWLDRDIAIAERDALRVSLEAEVERQRTRARIQASCFDQRSQDLHSLQVEVDEAIAQAERHAEDAITAEAERDALRVTVAERDATIARLGEYLDESEDALGRLPVTPPTQALGAMVDDIRAALDGPDDRSGESR